LGRFGEEKRREEERREEKRREEKRREEKRREEKRNLFPPAEIEPHFLGYSARNVASLPTELFWHLCTRRLILVVFIKYFYGHRVKEAEMERTGNRRGRHKDMHMNF
jgi:hypothetical protein